MPAYSSGVRWDDPVFGIKWPLNNPIISEKDLAELGRETIQQEIQSMLKWLKIKQAFNKISEGLKSIDEKSYYEELEKIRKSSWDEYKKELDI